jgi:hypothetical protein
MTTWLVNTALVNHTKFTLRNDGFNAMGVEKPRREEY